MCGLDQNHWRSKNSASSTHTTATRNKVVCCYKCHLVLRYHQFCHADPSNQPNHLSELLEATQAASKVRYTSCSLGLFHADPSGHLTFDLLLLESNWNAFCRLQNFKIFFETDWNRSLHSSTKKKTTTTPCTFIPHLWYVADGAYDMLELHLGRLFWLHPQNQQGPLALAAARMSSSVTNVQVPTFEDCNGSHSRTGHRPSLDERQVVLVPEPISRSPSLMLLQQTLPARKKLENRRAKL